MKSVDYAQARERLDEILNEAQRQPIVIRREDEEVAVLLSMADYERLRVSTEREFLALRAGIAREAVAAGLTEDQLSQLVDDD